MTAILVVTVAAAVVGLVARVVGARCPDRENALWRCALLAFWVVPAASFTGERVDSLQLRVLPATRLGGSSLAGMADLVRQTGITPASIHGDAIVPGTVALAPDGAGPGSGPDSDTGGGFWKLLTRQADLLALCVWAAGALLSLALLARDARAARRLTRLSTAPCPDGLRSALEHLATESGLRAPPAVAVSPSVHIAAVVGILRPVLVLPSRLIPSEAGARAVMAHEMAHIVRRDPLFAALARLTRALWWWHPLAHVAARQHRRSAELACDDRAVRVVDDPRGMAEQLAVGAEHALQAGALGIAGEGRHLVARVERLLQGRLGPPAMRRPLYALLVLGLVCLFAALGCVRSARSGMAERPMPDPACVLIVGADPSHSLADTVMLAFLGAETRRVALMSIPRDSWVEMQPEGADNIAHLHATYYMATGDRKRSLELFTQDVERNLDVEVDRAISVEVPQLRAIVDELGGVEMDIEQRMRYTDRSQGLFIDLQPGRQILDGEHALQYIRFRHDEKGDLGRVQRQLGLLKATAGRVRELGASGDVGALSRFVSLVRRNSCTDMPVGELLSIARLVSGDDTEVLTTVVPGDQTMTDSMSVYRMEPDGVAAQLREWVAGSAVPAPSPGPAPELFRGGPLRSDASDSSWPGPISRP